MQLMYFTASKNLFTIPSYRLACDNDVIIQSVFVRFDLPKYKSGHYILSRLYIELYTGSISRSLPCVATKTTLLTLPDHVVLQRD